MRQQLWLLISVCLAAPSSAQIQVNTIGDNSGSPNQSDGASVVYSNNKFVAVWAEQNGTDASTTDIWAAYMSAFSPTQWVAPTRVDLGDPANASDSEFPRILATTDDVLHVFWEDKRNGGGTEDLFYSRSTNGATTWLATPIEINAGTSGPSQTASDVDFVHAVADGTSLHVVWEDDAQNGNDLDEVRYRRSTDAGLTWSSVTLIELLAMDCDDPRVWAHGSDVVVAWLDDYAGSNRPYARRSTNGGASFSSKVGLTGLQIDAMSGLQLEGSGDLLIAAFFNDDSSVGGKGVHAVVSVDGGQSWSSELELAATIETTAGAQAYNFHLFVRDPDIFVAWSDDTWDLTHGGTGGTDATQVWLAYSNDRGEIWTTRSIDIDPSSVRKSPIVVSDGCVTFIQYLRGITGANEMVRARSEDRGATFAYYLNGSGPDVDQQDASQGLPLAIASDVNHLMTGLFWDRPLGHNELYSLTVTTCNPSTVSYCTSGTTSGGCVPALTTFGDAQATNTGTPFELRVSNMPPSVSSILFYGISGRQDAPWGSGSSSYLCVESPRQRIGVFTSTTGGGTCGGTLTRDWNNYTATHSSALGVPFMGGEIVRAQCWFRDPPAPKTTNLTHGVEFYVEP